MMRLILLGLLSLSVLASECTTNFSAQQVKALQRAYQVGADDNLGYTLAAIVWKESFVGPHIIRINTQSGQTGSWGLTHIQLTTAAHILGEKDMWVARAEIAPKLLTNDPLALSIGLEVLKTYKRQTDNWRELVASYNAGPGRRHIPQAIAYAEDVAGKVAYLKKCHSNEE